MRDDSTLRVLALTMLFSAACSARESLPLPNDPRTCAQVSRRPGAGLRSLSDAPPGPDVVDIAPGESVCLGLRAASRKLTFQMRTESSGATLLVHNPYAEVLTFSALVYLEGEEGGYPSTTCPVRPGLTGSEHWSEDVAKVVLSRFELHAPESPPTACE